MNAERTASGWPFAHRGTTLLGTFLLSQGLEAGSKISLVDVMADAAHLSWDGRDMGWAWGPDWSITLADALAAGVHHAEMLVLPSTYNHYGPHHHIDGDPKVTSPQQFTGEKNFADRADAPQKTHNAMWRVKPLMPPTAFTSDEAFLTRMIQR